MDEPESQSLVDFRVSAPSGATIETEVLASDEGSIVAGKEEDSVGNVFHIGNTTQRISFACLLDLGGHNFGIQTQRLGDEFVSYDCRAVGCIRINGKGRERESDKSGKHLLDRVHTNSLGSKVESQALGHDVQSSLGHAVRHVDGDLEEPK